MLGAGQWSTAAKFITCGYAGTAAPTLTAPGARATGVPALDNANVPQTVPFAWKAITGVTGYLVQVASDSLFTKPVFAGTANSPSLPVPDLLPATQYYWRIIPLTAAGSGPASLPGQFTTAAPKPAFPLPPTLVWPDDDAKDIPVNVRVTWAAMDYAAFYAVQVATDPSFLHVAAYRSLLTVPGGDLKLAYGTRYWWHVCSFSAGGVESHWSSARSFTTPALPSPTLLSPIDGSSGVSLEAPLSWQPVPNAVTYQVQAALDPDFTQLLPTPVSVTETTLALPPVASNITIYWKVQAVDAAGASQWTTPWSFTTGNILPPTLISPADTATGIAPSPTLTWNPSAGAVSYEAQLALDNAFTTVQMTLPATDVSVTATLNYDTTYYWQVRASDGNLWSNWSPARSFTTSSFSVPTLISPSAGATGIAVAPTLSWSATPGASLYDLQFSPDGTFATGVVENNALTTPAASMSSLQHQQTYWWRVRGGDGAHWSPWSTPWSFTTVGLCRAGAGRPADGSARALTLRPPSPGTEWTAGRTTPCRSVRNPLSPPPCRRWTPGRPPASL